MTDPMSRPAIHPLEPRGRDGQRLRFANGSAALEIDTSVASGEVSVLHEVTEPDGCKVYRRWRGTLEQAVAMLLAADQARALFDRAADTVTLPYVTGR